MLKEISKAILMKLVKNFEHLHFKQEVDTKLLLYMAL